MECSKCEEEKELMPRRKVCRTCFNKEKVIQRQNRIPNEREEECRKCFQIKTIPKGKTWCKECKNDYEKLRKSKFTEKITFILRQHNYNTKDNTIQHT